MESNPVQPVPRKQEELNAGTRRHWQAYASHRRAIERLLAADLPAPRGRLCVLGAGNCNDLDLGWLLSVFREVHLVDIDPAALAGAVRRQRVEDSPAVRRHAPVDLTGVADVIVPWAKSPPDGPAIDACVRRAAGHRVRLDLPDHPPARDSQGPARHLVDADGGRLIHPARDGNPADDPVDDPAAASRRIGGFDAVLSPRVVSPAIDADMGAAQAGFDVVLSPCVLSQLLNPARDTLGARHPRFPQVLAALRAGHLRSMAALLAPGGVGLLVTDLLSSDTFSALPRVPEEQAPDAMRKALADGNHFEGLDPASLTAALKGDRFADVAADQVRTSRPWLWHLGWRRTYLVYAVRFRIRGRATPDGRDGGILVVP